MVFLTACNFLRQMRLGRPGGGVDRFWRVQQYLRFAWVSTINQIVKYLYYHSEHFLVVFRPCGGVMPRTKSAD